MTQANVKRLRAKSPRILENMAKREVEHKNILLIGRTRTGKSTIKSLLVNPTNVPGDLTLKSGTRDPHFQAFHLRDEDTVLNVIDTPGLFEHSSREMDIRDNDMILRTIGFCINMEITKFHMICFCVSLTVGINNEDIESLHLLIEYFGIEASKNSCLVITRCESIDERQREKLKRELLEDVAFKRVAPFFKLGVFFSGSIDRNDYKQGNESVYKQFAAISDYRERLIEQILQIKEPISIEKMASSSSKFAHAYRANITAKQTPERRQRETSDFRNRPYYNSS